MDQYIVRLKDRSKRKLFLELLKQLDFVEDVKQVKNASKTKAIAEFLGALNEVEQHQKGHIQLRNAKDFLNELWGSYHNFLWEAGKETGKKACFN